MKNLRIALSALTLACLVNYQPVVADGVPGKKTAAKPAVLKVDPAKSTMTWTGRKVGGQHSGTVKLSKGDLQLDGTKLVGGAFDIDMKSIVNTDLTDASTNAKFMGHMKSDDFFAVEKHPTAKFKITKATPIAGAAAGQPNYTIDGDLTIKGITNAVSFPAAVTVSGNSASATAKFDLDRTKWDIKYGSGLIGTAADKVIYDDFNVDLKVVAAK